jgi:hypothetical protein
VVEPCLADGEAVELFRKPEVRTVELKGGKSKIRRFAGLLFQIKSVDGKRCEKFIF